MRSACVCLQPDHLFCEPCSQSAHRDTSLCALADNALGDGGGSIRRGSGAGSDGPEERIGTDAGGGECVAQADKLAASASVASFQCGETLRLVIALILHLSP
jgi:hypothetical protein